MSLSPFLRFSRWLNNLIMTRLTGLDRPGARLRFFFRAPVHLYRLGLGGLAGKRFLLLTTTGRKTGEPHRVALEYDYDSTSDTWRVMAGWGGNTDWVKNLRHSSQAQVQVGRRCDAVHAEELDEAGVAAYLAEINHLNPGACKIWERWAKQPIDGSLESLRRAAPFFPTFRLHPDYNNANPTHSR